MACRMNSVILLMSVPTGCQDSEGTRRSLSFAQVQVDAVQVGWSRDLIIKNLGPSHEELAIAVSGESCAAFKSGARGHVEGEHALLNSIEIFYID
jgi:hypothetical protein